MLRHQGLDGYLARVLHAQSAFGKLFDPIADKMIVATASVMLVNSGMLSGVAVVPVIIILCREIFISGSTLACSCICLASLTPGRQAGPMSYAPIALNIHESPYRKRNRFPEISFKSNIISDIRRQRI